MSFTNSRMLPSSVFVGLAAIQQPDGQRALAGLGAQHRDLRLPVHPGDPGAGLRARGADRSARAGRESDASVFLYPFSMSFIVTGLAWRWLLDPTFGIEKLAHDLGLSAVHFDWLVRPERVIYTLVVAAVWHASGLVMAIMLAGLRGVDPGNLEGDAGGWHSRLAGLRLHHRAVDARQLRDRRRAARDQRGAAVRPVGGDDQWRAGDCLGSAGQVRDGSPVRPRQCRAGDRRRDLDADHGRRGGRAVGLLAVPAPARGARHERDGDRAARPRARG